MESRNVKNQINTSKILEMGNQFPPQAINVEKAVLGSFMVEPITYYEVSNRLSSDHFYTSKHRLIFEVICEQANKEKPYDMFAVEQRINELGKIEEVGGNSSYLFELNQDANPTNVEYNSQILHEMFIRRQVILRSHEAIAEAFDQSNDTYDMLDRAELNLFTLMSTDNSKQDVWIGDMLGERLSALEQRMETKGIIGISSGLVELDHKLSGFQNGELTVVGARPSMGKTQFLLNVIRNAALTPSFLEQDKTIAFFSLEMSSNAILDRLISMEAQINSERFRNGKISSDELKKASDASSNLFRTNIRIDDTPALTINQLKNKVRKIARTRNLGMVCIDYIGLMRGMGEQTREREVAVISGGLKQLAKELNIPVIALCQLSREVVKRGKDPRPALSDLRESGAIEQDADVVILIHRPEYYGITSDGERSLINIAELLVAKQRNGPVGIVEVSFIKELGIFRDLSSDAFFEEVEVYKN